MCNNCEWFYLGQTANLKQRIRKHKSDVFYPQNTFVQNAQNIYAIVVEWKSFFWEFKYFYMTIQKNYASLKKNILPWDGNQVDKSINKQSQ